MHRVLSAEPGEGVRRFVGAHLLMEVATGEQVVTREEFHARMRRFSRLLVLRPDGYLVRATTGVAVQKAGQVVLAEDGTLRAGRFEVGPFRRCAPCRGSRRARC
jgi:hypothetical protein